jgi:hypothetical protein
MAYTSETTRAGDITGTDRVQSGASCGDLAIQAYLGFLDKEIASHPELVQPLDAQLIADMGELVGGIDVDLDEDPGDCW